ncbi:MAG TPA: AcvB/VirJ family lysyl-phosphatidylglycerol hydrolase [Sphingobium sp.]|nr:AcvB/VirJ family lysyl-phosphatidylglycerol hydrolase [Sphingobium sp.]
MPILPRTLLAYAGLLAAGLLATAAVAPPPSPAETLAISYNFAPFGPVAIVRPAGEPRGVVLFLSDSNGVSGVETAIGRELARRGLLVAMVSTPRLMDNAQSWGRHCLNANYPLVALSNDVQHRMGVKAYMKPVILGAGEGGALAYASLSQWANGSYQGVVSLGFAPQIASRKPWCTAPGFSAEPVDGGSGWQFGPNLQIRLPWIAMHAAALPPAAAALTEAVPHARALPLPGVTSQWPEPVANAVTSLLPAPITRAQAGGLPLPDMPLTLVPPQPGPANRDVMAIIYSGDGGWVGIDRDVAGKLAAAGIPVVGVDSLAYFWTARTPAGAGRDLGQLINAFSRHWARPRVLLIGYSFGADVLPAMVAQLDPATRARISRLSLLGLSATADFQFHLSSWLDIGSDTAQPTIPAIVRLRGVAIQCVQGENEADSACPDIPAGLAQHYVVPGGHHFDRNAGLLAQIVLGQRRAGTLSD